MACWYTINNKFNKWIHFLLCVVDIFSQCARVIPVKDKKDFTITNAFQKLLKESNHNSNKIWVDKGSWFYNRSMKSWPAINDIEVYSMHNKVKSVVSERFIKTLKNDFYKYMTLIIWKNVYIDKLDDMVNKYNNTFHRTIKMKQVDVNSNTYINSSKKVMIKILRLTLVMLLEYQNIKSFLQNAMFRIG